MSRDTARSTAGTNGSARASTTAQAETAAPTVGAATAPTSLRAAAPPPRPGPGPAPTADLAAHLASLANADVAALLLARPDLLAPPSSSFTALAARAGARPSVDAALADLDAPTLAVAEAVVALGSQDPALLAPALGLTEPDVAGRIERLRDLALVLEPGPVAGLVDSFGPHPFGLGPWSEAAEDARRPAPDAAPGAPRGEADPAPPARALPPTLDDLAASGELSEAALGTLRALTWGPPVGTVREGGRAPGAAELARRGWLERGSDPQGRTRLTMPREVGLALRGGRLLQTPLEAPSDDSLDLLPLDAVASDASRHAEEAVRLVAALLAEWSREGGPVLRTGGVGVRALARTAEALSLAPETAATVIETAAAAGLLGLDDGGASWVPASAAASWLEAPLAERWAALAAPWADSARTPWLVGSRGDDGVLRPVLGADVEAGWARMLRRRVLALLSSLPEGTAVTPEWVRESLAFARPRRVVPAGAVAAVLDEAELLGLTGGGALSRAGRVLAAGLVRREEEDRTGSTAAEAPGATGATSRSATGASAAPVAPVASAASGSICADGAGPALLGALEDALAADLPDPVDVLLIQSDLTAVVPGRPGPALAALLERSSAVESRGGALTVRFTEDSVRGALDAGMTGEQLLEALGGFSLSPLPATLTALVDDAVRRHGTVRVREVASVLRVDDPATAAGLLADQRLADLALAELAPGVIVSSASGGRVLRELRAAGLSPVLEDATGRLVLAGGAARSRAVAPAPEPTAPGERAVVRRRRPGPRELAGLVGRLRAGEAARAAAGEGGAATDPVHALAVLRQAQVSKERLRLRLAGPDGAVQERRVRVLAVEPGRVRLADVVRETELTVAVHRIVSVEAL